MPIPENPYVSVATGSMSGLSSVRLREFQQGQLERTDPPTGSTDRRHRRRDHGRQAQTLSTVSAAMESSTPPRSTAVIHGPIGLRRIAITPRIAMVNTAAVVLVNPCTR